MFDLADSPPARPQAEEANLSQAQRSLQGRRGNRQSAVKYKNRRQKSVNTEEESRDGKNINVVVIDSEEIYFYGLCAALNNVPGVHFLPYYANRDSFFAADSKIEPSVAFVDVALLQLENQNRPAAGESWLFQLLEKFPHLRIFLLYRPGEEELVSEIRSLGAHGRIMRDAEAKTFRDALSNTSALERAPLASTQQRKQSSNPWSNKRSAVRTSKASRISLTNREGQVLTLLAEGLTDTEIANRLNIRTGTARKHAENIRAKLGVSSRTAAVVKAESVGLLTLSKITSPTR